MKAAILMAAILTAAPAGAGDLDSARAAGSSQAQAQRVAKEGGRLGPDGARQALERYVELLKEGLDEQPAANAALRMTRARLQKRGESAIRNEERRERDRQMRRRAVEDERRLRREGPEQPSGGRIRR